MTRRSAIDRFNDKVEVVEGGCHEWLGARENGYGIFINEDNRRVYAHRWLYEWLEGPIPKDLTCDHICHTPDCRGGVLCRHRRCVNPEHIELVTRQENARRRMHKTQRTAPTQCMNGHERSPDNIDEVVVNGVVKYRCAQCHRDNARKWYRKDRDQRIAQLEFEQDNDRTFSTDPSRRIHF